MMPLHPVPLKGSHVLPEVVVFSLVALVLVAVLMWFQQRRSGNASWIDVYWSLAVGVVGLSYLVAGEGWWQPRLLSGLLLAYWSFRLGSHLYRRLSAESGEDQRYVAMRTALGSKFEPFIFIFFLGQALLAWLFSLPFYFIAHQTDGFSVLMWLGFAVGVIAIFGESVADKQLSSFKDNPGNKGKVCQQGLWAYSRHPNYFFEWLHWFSYPLIAVGATGYYWLWLLPVAMFLFLWYVTGIPYTERQSIKSRGDAYREYQRTTSPFFPWRSKV